MRCALATLVAVLLSGACARATPDARAGEVVAGEPQPRPSDAAVQRALPVANAALDRAYAEFARRPAVIAPAHSGPWVDAASAVVKPDGAGGHRVTWERYAPAGYELAVEVAVRAGGAVEVVRAMAMYSPD